MEKPLYFVSGLPRTGSTLMMNLLGQNPSHYVTPTSGLIHLMRAVMRTWPECQEFQSQGLENVKTAVLSSLRGLLHGFFEQPLSDGKVVFDKSRGWINYVEPLEEILGRRVQIITLVRDVRAIVSSYEKVYRRRGIEYRYPTNSELLRQTQSVEGRARRALQYDRVTGRSVLRLRDALARCPDRLLIVPYRYFTREPAKTMATIHEWLGLPPHVYDTDHVQQITHEDDNYLGVDLHRIQPKIEQRPEAPWQGLLPEAIEQEIAEQYDDINTLSAGDVLDGAELLK